MSSKIGTLTPEQIRDRAATLEAQLARAEANEEWDALEPELITLRAAVYREIASDRAELAQSKDEYKQKYGWLAHLNPFDSGARDKWKNTVSRKQFELQAVESLEDRVRQLTEKFYADKTRKFAREFIRVTEKIQRGITGSWDQKAGAVAGALLARVSGEETIERGRRAQDALLAAGFHNEAPLMAAVIASELPADRAIAAATQVRDGLRAQYGEGAELLAAAALAGGRSAGEALRVGEQVAAERGGDRTANAMIGAAILLAGVAPEAAFATARAVQELPKGGSATARARVAAAAILSGKPAEEVRRYAAAAAEVLRMDPELGSMNLAGAILSARDPDTSLVLAREVAAAVHGTAEAEATIVSAAVASKQDPAESIAFAKHLQSALTGTWESEAFIIGAALIAHGLRDEEARGREAARIAGAYIIPGLLAAGEE